MGLNCFVQILKDVVGISFKKVSKSSGRIEKMRKIRQKRKRSQLSLDLDRTEIVNDIEPLDRILIEVVESCILDSAIKTPDDFFQNLINRLTTRVLNFEWLSKAPKDKKELEIFMRKYNLWKKYCAKFNSLGYYKVVFGAPERSNRYGFKRIPV